MEIYLNNKPIEVIIKRKPNKNIYFRFDDDLNLNVTANRLVSEKEILRLINKNAKSLERMLNKSLEKKNHDEEFWYLGNSYQVVFDENAYDVEFYNGKIISKNSSKLNTFIKNKTEEIFKREVEDLKGIIPTPKFTLKIRRMKTRWGVCNYKNMTITLNSELIKYRVDLLRYVIIHEMCHFYHHNHSEDFWNMVKKYYPNYKDARKELRG